MQTSKNIFERNKKWSDKIKQTDPAFFTKLSKEQKPEYLWIGCSDSRVPANTISGMLPGELFVHRNIANLVIHTDLNCLSVIQYAVEVLKVKHIILCGHYGCGGVKASIDNEEHGLIDNWLVNIRNIYLSYRTEIEKIADEKEKLNSLCEINAIEQVKNICQSTVIQKAWKSGQKLTVHGWIYNLENGILSDLDVSTSCPEGISQIGWIK
ncbi:MAG TPA: carbonate dehydratase [Victivallales bacterium]|nr:carbonate dehydratase [Victivallales bacterium]